MLVTVLLTVVAASIAYSVAYQTVLMARSVNARSDSALAVDLANTELGSLEARLTADPTLFMKEVLPTERARVCVTGPQAGEVHEPRSAWPSSCGVTWDYQRAASPGPVRIELALPSPDATALTVRVLARVGDTDAGVEATFVTSAGRWVWASTSSASLASASPSETVTVDGNLYAGGNLTTPSGGGVTVTNAQVGADGLFSSAPTPFWGSPDDTPVPADYDGDGDTDRATFRASDGRWAVADQDTEFFGTSGDIPVPADYDGDGDDDVAVWRPSEGRWYFQTGSTEHLGTSGDIPVPADYDGDGDDDVAVWRPSNGSWYVLGVITGTAHGTSGDIPVPGDYDGDGDDDLAVWRPSTGQWLISGQVSPYLGEAANVPAPADYDGDGDVDPAVWDSADGGWYVGSNSPVFVGANGDSPVAGDYDGDGAADVVAWRPSTGGWYSTSTPGTLDPALRWFSRGSGGNGVGDIRAVQPAPLTAGALAVHASRLEAVACPSGPMVNIDDRSSGLCLRPGEVALDADDVLRTVPENTTAFMIIPGVGDEDLIAAYSTTAPQSPGTLLCEQPCSLPSHAGAMMGSNTHPGELAYWTHIGDFQLPASGVIAVDGDVHVGACSGAGHEYANGVVCEARTGDQPGVRVRKSFTVVAGSRQAPHDAYLGSPINTEGAAQVAVIATDQVFIPYWARAHNAEIRVDAHLIGLGLGTMNNLSEPTVSAFPSSLPYSGEADANWAARIVITGSVTGRQLPLGLAGVRDVALRHDPRARTAAPPWFPGTDQGWYRFDSAVLSGGEVCAAKACDEW